MPDRLIEARDKVGELKLRKAFNSVTFVYGTQGKGSVIVKGLKAWAGHAKTRDSKNPGDQQIEKVIARELNLFDPGRRAEVYLAGGYQMMDMYYGQAGNNIYKLRNPVIAEFVHYAMGFKTSFKESETGRDAYMFHFKTQTEGWRENSGTNAAYGGLTATKEISRIIRWGIQTMGGTLIFEGRELYYWQVFDTTAPRVSDTDLEAQELFKFFVPNTARVPFGKGTLIFNWAGKETIPTKYHFMTNWQWNGSDNAGKPLMHSKLNLGALSFTRQPSYRPIWDNFTDVPASLAGVDKAKLLAFVAHHGPRDF
ncbi:MAG: hypothetical protein JSR71_00665 [Proteobacteria bacterium]|nr:hypothetical protein [Pseudomonadota bacterium]